MDLAYYGDDFTGSTDVLESLAGAGIDTELFVDAAIRGPTRAVGLAGLSRTFTPAEMDDRLPEAFAALAAGGPRFLHYKVCSTFDSSPAVGSIGRAIEIGRRVAPGKSDEITWKFSKSGEFNFACLIPGHFEAGMIGRITVK